MKKNFILVRNIKKDKIKFKLLTLKNMLKNEVLINEKL